MSAFKSWNWETVSQQRTKEIKLARGNLYKMFLIAPSSHKCDIDTIVPANVAAKDIKDM